MAVMPKIKIEIPPHLWPVIEIFDHDRIDNIGFVSATTQAEAIAKGKLLLSPRECSSNHVIVKRLASCEEGWRYYS